MRILFITSNRIGDALLSSGLLARLVDTYRDARFTVAAGPAAAPLFADMPRLEQLVPFEKQPRAGHWRGLWKKCIRHRWELVVDLRGSAISWLLWTRARAVHSPVRSEQHRVVQLARVLDLAEPADPRIWCSAAKFEEAERIAPGNEPILAIGPTANWRGKQWPAERFAELAARITRPGGALPGARVMIFGGPGERDMALPLIGAVPEAHRIDVVGKLDLLTAYACLRKAALYVGNDSGLMHLSAVAGAPTLGLFGPSREVHYAPWGERTMAVRGTQSFEDIVSAPGYDHLSDDCHMTALSVDRVEQAAIALLDRCAAS